MSLIWRGQGLDPVPLTQRANPLDTTEHLKVDFKQNSKMCRLSQHRLVKKYMFDLYAMWKQKKTCFVDAVVITILYIRSIP